MKKILSIISAAILAISLAACGSQPTLVGKWSYKANPGTVIESTYYYEFDSNNKYTLSEYASDYSHVDTGTYTIHDNQLKFFPDNMHAAKSEFYFELKDNNTLVLDDDHGNVVEFKRDK